MNNWMSWGVPLFFGNTSTLNYSIYPLQGSSGTLVARSHGFVVVEGPQDLKKQLEDAGSHRFFQYHYWDVHGIT